MNKLIFILISFASVLVSCKNNSVKEKEVKNKKTKEMISEDKMTVIYPTLLEELEDVITYRDSIDMGSSIIGNVYIVFFSESKGDCYVTIFQSLCYYQSFYPQTLSHPSYNLEGYTLLNGKMIAFYNPESNCNKGLVDITKLKKGKPKDFPGENSDIAVHTNYDPWGKKYKIHSKDSLELVYSGYL